MKPIIETDALVAFTQPVGPFAMNQGALVCRSTGDAALIDPGGDPEPFLIALERLGATPRMILLTHAHIDHVLGLPATHARLGLPIHLHPLDQPLYDAVPMQARMFGVPCGSLPAVTDVLAEGEPVTVGKIELSVLHTPGHAPGHVCFHAEAHHLLFGGDLLFHGSIGRVDLPGASADDMRRSLARIATLPAETIVLPGHMAHFRLGEEVRTNPFLLDPSLL